MKWWKHLRTINAHKKMVRKLCFKLGLYKQGLLHDLSKYSPAEFLVGAKYYQGFRSPNNKERETIGYSSAWLHHKGRNKHHYEYWVDYGTKGEKTLVGVQMPLKYTAEMLADRIAASKNYEKEKYTDESPLKYYEKGKDNKIMHKETDRLLHEWLVMLAGQGEDATLAYVKGILKEEKERKKKNSRNSAE